MALSGAPVVGSTLAMLAASQRVPALLYLIAAVIGAGGQYLYKRGSQQLGAVPVVRNAALLGGVASFCVVMVLFVTAYRLGGRLSVVYPFYATTFVWATLIGIRVDHEPWSIVQVLGVLVTVAGVVMIAVGSSR
jgi:drug/metabolite transporter (DMT)-like permease